MCVVRLVFFLGRRDRITETAKIPGRASLPVPVPAAKFPLDRVLAHHPLTQEDNRPGLCTSAVRYRADGRSDRARRSRGNAPHMGGFVFVFCRACAALKPVPPFAYKRKLFSAARQKRVFFFSPCSCSSHSVSGTRQAGGGVRTGSLIPRFLV